MLAETSKYTAGKSWYTAGNCEVHQVYCWGPLFFGASSVVCPCFHNYANPKAMSDRLAMVLANEIINVGLNQSALCLAVLCNTDATQGALPAT